MCRINQYFHSRLLDSGPGFGINSQENPWCRALRRKFCRIAGIAEIDSSKLVALKCDLSIMAFKIKPNVRKAGKCRIAGAGERDRVRWRPGPIHEDGMQYRIF